MAEIIRLGSLLLDGNHAHHWSRYRGRKISFGDTTPRGAIPFVKYQKLLGAGEVICPGVPWSALDKQGFITGRPVCIDGITYLCRSLKVGMKEGESNEWDSILDDLGEDDNLWKWNLKFFWGREGPMDFPSFRTVRGYYSARSRDTYSTNGRSTNVGFRPVLEPLPPMPPLSVGGKFKIYGPDKDVSGRLVDFSDYDLIMEPKAGLRLPAKCHQWARRDGSHIIIDRTAITWMKEEL